VFANRRIVISRVIQSLVMDKYHKDSDLIANGVLKARPVGDNAVLKQLALEEARYVLLVSRLVPEKRHLDLISAFRQAKLNGWKLCLVGDVSAGGNYIDSVTEASGGDVVIAGYRSGQELVDLLSGAALFVLPSSHEGLPIALLEAMSYGLPVVASDIPAHLELELNARCYFSLGDVAELSERLTEMYNDKEFRAQQSHSGRVLVREGYNWKEISVQTAKVYDLVVS